MGTFICGGLSVPVSERTLAKTEALIGLFLQESRDLLEIKAPHSSLGVGGVSAGVAIHYWTPGVPLAFLYDVSEVPDLTGEDLEEVRRVFDMTKERRIAYFLAG